MADFREDLRKFEKRFKTNISKLLSNDFLSELGAEVKDTVYKRTKSGYGAESGSKTKLKPLSQSYVNYRSGSIEFKTKDGKTVKFKAKKPSLGSFGSPKRSNLTLTGQMLESIDYKVTKNGVTIFIPSSKRKDSELTNAEVANFVQEHGRTFFELTDSEVTKVQRTIINKLRELAKSI